MSQVLTHPGRRTHRFCPVGAAGDPTATPRTASRREPPPPRLSAAHAEERRVGHVSLEAIPGEATEERPERTRTCADPSRTDDARRASAPSAGAPRELSARDPRLPAPQLLHRDR